MNPLAHALRPQVERHASIVGEPDVCGLFQNASSHLQKGTHTNATQAAARQSSRSARFKTLPIGQQQGLVQNGFKFSTVIGQAIGRFVGHR